MIRTLFCFVFLSCAASLFAEPTGQLDLASNGGLEIVENNLPKDWRVVTTWGPKGKFASDEAELHTGQRSFRISADESSQNYLATDVIPCSPGDVFSCSAWVKTKDVKVGDNGKVQIQGVLAREDGNDNGVTVAPLKLSNEGNSEWTHLQGDLKIPAQTTKAWIRFGMHDATGTSWWDDLEIHPHDRVAARIDVKGQRISPAAGGIAVTIINRDARHAAVKLAALLGKSKGETTVQLTGEAQQSASIPIEFDQPGLLDCTVAVSDTHGELFKQKRKVNIPPPVAIMPPIPTHWAKEDGPADVSGEIDLGITNAQLKGAALSLKLLDSDNKVLNIWKNSAPLTDGWNHWEMKPGDLPLGDYTLSAELVSHGGPSIKDQQAWHVINRADSKVILNANGYLEYKAQPIFPLGIFNGGGKMKELGEAGMTVSHAYNAMNVVQGEPAPDEKPLAFLDDTQRAGMMCLFLVPREFVFHHEWDNVRRRIRMFRNHPALLAWDEEEGLARGSMKPEDLKTLVQIIREEDPNHPVMIGDSRDGIRKVVDRSNFFPIDQMDLGMWWWYPLPIGGGTPSALNGEEAARGLEMAPPSFLTQRNTAKPIWVGVQSYKKPQSWARYPTPTEYRAQAYLSIIHGAKGLMWYGGGVEGGIFGNPEEGHWDDLKALSRELHELAPVFMAASGEAPKFSPQSALISVMLKQLPDRTILLAANRGATLVKVAFAIKQPSPAKVLYEKRDVPIQGGTLTDHFDPYGVHVYEFAK